MGDSETAVPEWVTYPGEEWETITPEEAGLDVEKWQRVLAETPVRPAAWQGERHGDGEFGFTLARAGYRLHTWGNGGYRFQTASLGKSFTIALVGLAVDEGLIRDDDLVRETWTGEGELSHPHKYLDRGKHRKLQKLCG